MNQHQSDALDDYFGALLAESESDAAPSAEPQPQVNPAPSPLATKPFAEPQEAERHQTLEALLAQVAELKEEEGKVTTTVIEQPEVKVAPVVAPVVEPEPVIEPVVAKPAPEIITDVETAPEPMSAAPRDEWRNMDTEHSFQVLFFEVAGMTFAVPLTHLGGIYQMSKLTSLFGKPDWFAGMLTERERQLYVVDTARWAMPGHQSAEEYEYLVTLGDSNWGLSCHQLKGTALLTREQVKWRVTPGARPWLAGMVKEKMCALLHVDALISLLEQGKNIDGQQV